jgi:hypothetical protein
MLLHRWAHVHTAVALLCTVEAFCVCALPWDVTTDSSSILNDFEWEEVIELNSTTIPGDTTQHAAVRVMHMPLSSVSTHQCGCRRALHRQRLLLDLGGP